MRTKLPVFLAILSLGFYTLCIITMKDGAENIISGQIRQGTYSTSYHYIDGWSYDYTGVQQFLYATGIFLAIYYGSRIFSLIRKKRWETFSAAVLASYVVCVGVIVITQTHLLGLIVGATAVFVALALAALIHDLQISEDIK